MTNHEAIEILKEEWRINAELFGKRFEEAVRIAIQALNTIPFMQDMSNTIDGLRAENEVILRRLKHLLESDYISQFDQVDPNTQKYIRDIREADRKVMYLCDQEKPCKEHCEKDHLCKRTSDISHAKNFRLVPNGIYPIIFEEVDEHCIANVTFDREELEKIIDERVIEPIKNGELVVKEEDGKWGKWIISEIRCPNCMEYFQLDCYSMEELKKCPVCGEAMIGGIE